MGTCGHKLKLVGAVFISTVVKLNRSFPHHAFAILLALVVSPNLANGQDPIGELFSDDLDSMLSPSDGSYGSAPATPPPVVASPDAPAAPEIPYEEIIWHTPRKRRLENYVQADYLLWWAGDSQLPALLKADPAGTAAGNVGTTSSARTIYGNQTVGDWPHSGLRLRLGHFVDRPRISRLELDLWYLFQGSDDFRASTGDSTDILSRPFFNTQTGANDAQLIQGGTSDGFFESNYTRQAGGIDPSIFFCLSSSACRWFELSTGYRFLWLQDELELNERSLLTPGPFVAAGSGYEIQDRFTADNQFHLWTIGLSHSENKGKWLVNVRGKIGLGVVTNEVEIRGSTRSFVGDTTTATDDAGFLALQTNRGKHSQTKFAYVPELNGMLKRRMGKHTTAHVGYTVLWLPDVVQAADHVPTSIDPRNLPIEQPGAGPDPKFEFVTDSLVMHGLNFGLRYDW